MTSVAVSAWAYVSQLAPPAIAVLGLLTVRVTRSCHRNALLEADKATDAAMSAIKRSA